MAEQIEWRNARLRSIRDLTSDIRLFEIEPAADFVPPTPGSHINIVVQINSRPDVRCYSAVGPCTDGVYRIAVKLLPDTRGGSKYMWSLTAGAQLTISTPGNHFELSRGRPEYLLLAGGIGITPIFTMAMALAHESANFRLLYACRRRQDLALGEELKERIGDRLKTFIDEEGARIDLDFGDRLPLPGRGILCLWSDRPARGCKAPLAAARPAHGAAAVRDLRKQRPLRL